METKFTPGKWSVAEAVDRLGLEVYNDDALPTRVAVIPYKDFEGQANAKLIAAAPLLLGTLIEIRKECDGIGVINEGWLKNLIDPLIKKATE